MMFYLPLHLTLPKGLNEDKERELSTLRQKLTAVESDSQKRISDLENQLTAALSSTAATTGEWFEYQLMVIGLCF